MATEPRYAMIIGNIVIMDMVIDPIGIVIVKIVIIGMGIDADYRILALQNTELGPHAGVCLAESSHPWPHLTRLRAHRAPA